MAELKRPLTVVESEIISSVLGERSARTGAHGLYSNSDISIFLKLGPQFGINVDILKKEGEEYEYTSVGKTDKQKTHRGSVPQGKSYISISNIDPAKPDLSDFWKAVNAEKASKKTSANPPKI